MELRVLNYFLTVAREKTISKAAAVLHLSQPTLSKQLKDLEEELGVQLFIRGNREISLTEDGVYLQNRGKEILSLVDTTTANLQKNEVIGGDILIGGGETQAFQFLSVILNDLMEKYPDINVHMYSGNADDVKDKIDKGLLDFGLVIDPVEKQKYEYLSLPVADRWGILVNEKHELAGKENVSPQDLKDHSLLISNQTLVNNQLSEWLGGNLSNFNIIGSYNLLYNASLLVKEGQSAAFCIDGIIHTQNSGLVFIPLEPSLTSRISIIWKRKQIFSNAGSLFLEKLMQIQ
ncbi:LysR family transcriptional regulator [Enterococcus hulanensis]|uniref:LysR family transcriptional regulator n=1 Tax=Enterococcus hulanensis TaxID=2559929 RepID=A0ABU3ETY2_9ENTE|nr:LysR family transcriptional regulator [Enterococcus hulanensis]MDT2598310.1 LysR family transcriptional regulator [Enterococcus hulanensis]MDT2608185.1 LysR family transcriptional regulator [Enterococcus hulanensis]MDT2615480.1 LysR family transcriptional regulator [Enterococcus hulanensis]MDT2626549.1 LysR family transcriptional regulator [Enterococcus hulanensis]MDT2654552.1 LysR family transcriptional regulator [Enterococcus hulanensis]